MFVVVDTETEKLDNPSKLWLVVLKEVDSKKLHVFRNLHSDPQAKASLQRLFSSITGVIGHNIIGFDYDVLHRLAGVTLDPTTVIDTLVVDRLLNSYSNKDHSLEGIGGRLDYEKGKFSDFSQYSKEMEDYCIRDVEVTYRYYISILPFLSSLKWKDSLRLEHNIAFISQEMTTNGFAFDLPKAKEIYKEITTKLQTLDQELAVAFPPKPVFIKEITPRETKHGTLHRGDFRWLQSLDLTPFASGVPFSRVEFEPFNPGSPKQIVERLNEAGWQPYEKTKGHIQAERDRDHEKLAYYATYGWKVSEDNLATLPKDAPEAARKLVQRLLLDSRRSTLEEWFNAYSPHDKRIHGRFHHIGAWTHRMSHSGPNMANIPATPTPKGKEPTAVEALGLWLNPLMRSCWTVDEGNWLVGVDADGIQLRILAHYMNDIRFTEALVKGRKEDGTDAHTLNQKALGPVCSSRDVAKTFIYAFLLGAGVLKISQILGCTLEEAKEARDRFIEANPGLAELKDHIIPRDAARGYFIGLDGRAVMCDSEHLMLAGYLQNGEAIVMKKANLIWRKNLRAEGINFKQVNFVHDEWQTEIIGTYDDALKAAKIQADSIREAGVLLKLRCPLEGSFLNSHKQLAIGRTWADTH
jgi:DNA polymerase-1